MTLPNFLIIGVAKSGTTSLAYYLNQHPEVFIPAGNKEPNFFITEGLQLPPFSGPADPATLYEKIYKYSVTDIESYQALFNNVSTERAIGEASVPYLYFPQAAERIKKYVPDAKMIVILRNPIDRAYSHYLMVREKYLLEPLEFSQAIEQETDRIHNNWGWDWHYVNMGLYFRQLKLYFELFDRQQIKISLYEDYCRDPLNVVQEIYRFISVDDHFVPDLSRRDKVSSASKSLKLKRFLNTNSSINLRLRKIFPKRLYDKAISLGNRWNNTPAPPLDSKIYKQLKKYFNSDILKLQDLVEIDLSNWL